jgi:RNA polymerase sigma factor (sigma-70 family)
MSNETDAEDLVQEAYLRSLCHLAGFRGGDRRAWLLTMVRNCCYDRLKQKGSHGQSTDFDEAVHSAGRLTSNPGTLLILEERAELVRQSLAELHAEYRDVLVLRELEQAASRVLRATLADRRRPRRFCPNLFPANATALGAMSNDAGATCFRGRDLRHVFHEILMAS